MGVRERLIRLEAEHRTLVRSALFWGLFLGVTLASRRSHLRWKQSHVLFDYEFGFIRRGLIGQGFGLLGVEPSLANFSLFAAAMLVAVALAFFLAVLRSSPGTFYCFSLAFFTSPLLFRNLVLDWGRFDQLGVIYMFAVLGSIGRRRRFDALVLCSPLLLLVHEAVLLWLFPLLVVVCFVEHRQLLARLVPLLVVVAGLVAAFGQLDVEERVFREYLATRTTDGAPDLDPVGILTRAPAIDVGRSLRSMHARLVESGRGPGAFLFLGSLVVPLLLIAHRGLALAAMGSILIGGSLFFVGVDYFRWLSLQGLVAFFTLLYAQQRQLIPREKLLHGYFLCLALAGLLGRPVGIAI